MRYSAVGILAHVDAGKTTLSEAMLYESGSIRKMGRVDDGDAFLDHYSLERARGITIFSKQAVIHGENMEITLLDTPGHVDFSAEMERTLQVLDCAILVISGSEGVQAHTETLWRLLRRYGIPVFLFVNKMDLARHSKEEILNGLKEKLGGNFMDFSDEGSSAFFENAATIGVEEMEEFFETGSVSEEHIRAGIRSGEILPCMFGAALKNDGVKEFLSLLERYAPAPEYDSTAPFGAKVYKIERDSDGKRLSFMKITAGRLSVRDEIGEEKVSGIRIYSGGRFETVTTAGAGQIAAVVGIQATRAGMGLGSEEDSELPVLEPIMTYRLILPDDADAMKILPKLREIEEEIPEMHMVWDEEKKEIHTQIMGAVQMEILQNIIRERTGYTVEFGGRSVVYRETIASAVEGVGHFEPLRHYAEVHLKLEPGERGSGVTIEDEADLDSLAGNWHRLILTYIAEKEHRGVLTGSPVTDIRITLMSGRAHLKHTMGGDFRQATYRAVRQGLMEAETVLLEPYYRFRLEIPDSYVGKAMTDLGRMSAKFDMPVMKDGTAVIEGTAPASEIDSYPAEVAASTGGKGRIACTPAGYGECHNTEEVVQAKAYDPEADLRNPTGSVFCTHGAGFYVPWNEVKDYMHLESCFSENSGRLRSDSEIETAAGSGMGERNGRRADGSGPKEIFLGMDEIDEIISRTYHANRKKSDDPGRNRWGARRKKAAAGETVISAAGVRRPGNDAGVREGAGGGAADPKNSAGFRQKTGKPKVSERKYLLVDGYNVIFAWPKLAALAEENIDSARSALLDIMCNYQGYTNYYLIVVFDAYRVQGHRTEWFDDRNIHVVFTKEAETADRYIERFTHENAKQYHITVATSDGLEQTIIRGQGAALISSREFEVEVNRVENLIRTEHAERNLVQQGTKTYLMDHVSDEVKAKLYENGENTGK
ncbi:MAG: TetM/TetW/TetO/TetS family tetracycline resistance ribosomal protection protein [[Clostridium] aminophilum]|uniref:translation factor GTPase family protein n=1 Tax=[Clostridium] aminophilum TaxID=1526 RepID=UPI0026EEEF80|nr:TetM/TetW/TetO/TetS family tetracycline resistance ribosomal protection protein [[Clostridium] aminophilum]MDD6197003.1 TetM/TetW/TetO/TetS family tetracycline resistance ribosomal protection protein [[Clostridium] aminophilum]